MKRIKLTVYKEKAILVGIITSKGAKEWIGPTRKRRRQPEDYLEELNRLAQTAGAIVTEQIIQHRTKLDPGYCLGRGKAEEIAQLVKDQKIDVIIFDNDLSPGQIRNLEKVCGTKVIDRSELILDIFATHARSKQAKLQVELAQLEYTLPRLKRLWGHLSRIEGGIGIGQRGPGEKQLEIDRRLARDRITRLKRELAEVTARRQREVAARSNNFTVALVGYTNAGKSTLMNTLTDTKVYVDDKLFSTLDTKTHVWKLKNGQKVLLSDTVGFIKNLPHHLVSSFHATLEEVTQADLLIHVVDAGLPVSLAGRPTVKTHVEAVKIVLKELGCDEKQIILALNKVDETDPLELTILRKHYPDAIQISARNKKGLDELEKKVTGYLAGRQLELDLQVSAGNGKLLAYLADRGQILKKVYEDGLVRIKVRLGPRDLIRAQELGAKKI
ncbi:MAG: GTPase HflX [Planctomycetes bacterium]|nr:GTPase HflX [Planctomycetota bacterium]